MLQLSLARFAPALAAALILASGTHYFGENVIAFQRQLSPETIDEKWRAYLQTAHTALDPTTGAA